MDRISQMDVQGRSVHSAYRGDLVLKTAAHFGYLGYYNRDLGYSPFEGFILGGDGMSGYNTYGSAIIGLRVILTTRLLL